MRKLHRKSHLIILMVEIFFLSFGIVSQFGKTLVWIFHEINHNIRGLVLLEDVNLRADIFPEEGDMDRVFIPTFLSPTPSWIQASSLAIGFVQL